MLVEASPLIPYFHPHVAGLWYYSDEPRPDPRGPGAIYEGLYTNISKENVAFSDFPFSKALPPYMKVK